MTGVSKEQGESERKKKDFVNRVETVHMEDTDVHKKAVLKWILQ
jgi:hypothetical protein